jgi:hypothetical protein
MGLRGSCEHTRINYSHVAVPIVPIFPTGMKWPNQVDPEQDVPFKAHCELFSTGLLLLSSLGEN